MSASAPYSSVDKMLRNCAPGFTVRQSTHSRVIQYSGKVYRSFPGSKFDNIEYGHIRKLVRYFGITDCAAKHLPTVIKAESKPLKTNFNQVIPAIAAQSPTIDAHDEVPKAAPKSK